MLESRWCNGLSISEEDLVAGGVGVRQGQQTCFCTTVDTMNIPVLAPRVEANQPRFFFLQIENGKIARRSLAVRLEFLRRTRD